MTFEEERQVVSSVGRVRRKWKGKRKRNEAGLTN